MRNSIAPSLTLEQFLNRPETKPACEYINGEIRQKPMPQGEHSLLQGKLCQSINQAATPDKIAYSFPELRCTFGGRSIVPDLVVFRWERIPLTPSRKIANRIETFPDWSIEILSPHQNQTKVLDNLLHCSQQGTELGWLIDPEEETVLVVFSDQRIQLFRGQTIVPILQGINFDLTPDNLFNWLQFEN